MLHRQVGNSSGTLSAITKRLKEEQQNQYTHTVDNDGTVRKIIPSLPKQISTDHSLANYSPATPSVNLENFFADLNSSGRDSQHSSLLSDIRSLFGNRLSSSVFLAFCGMVPVDAAGMPGARASWSVKNPCSGARINYDFFDVSKSSLHQVYKLCNSP